MKPSKKHDGRTITIQYTGGMEAPFNLTGTYTHRNRSGAFEFTTADGHKAVFERSDFVVVKGGSGEAEQVQPCRA